MLTDIKPLTEVAYKTKEAPKFTSSIVEIAVDLFLNVWQSWAFRNPFHESLSLFRVVIN